MEIAVVNGSVREQNFDENGFYNDEDTEKEICKVANNLIDFLQ